MSSPIMIVSFLFKLKELIAKSKKFFSGLPIIIAFLEEAYSKAFTNGPRSNAILLFLLQY